MTIENDIWAAAYGAAFANGVEVRYQCQTTGSCRLKPETIALNQRLEIAREARAIATEAVKGLQDVQEAEMSPDEKAAWANLEG